MNGIEKAINNRFEKENDVTEIMSKFTVANIDDRQNTQIYTGYGEYTFIWEKTYVKSPGRSMDGSMGNLATQTTFVTPHMTATFDIMPINDYRRIVKQALSANEFVVTCYDTINDVETTNRMYFGTLQSPKYLTRTDDDGTVTLIGVRDYTVELIGTNNKL